MASRILHEFTIDKIAAVDRPCQEHATVAIMKRDNSDELRKREIAQQVLKLKLDVLGAQVEKAWSDAARRASAEARRARARMKEIGEDQHEGYTSNGYGVEDQGIKARNAARDIAMGEARLGTLTKPRLRSIAGQLHAHARDSRRVGNYMTDMQHGRGDKQMVRGAWNETENFHRARAVHLNHIASKL